MHLSQAIHSKLYCTVCEVFLGSKANYALHVLTKEHCENLIKVGKPEPKDSKNEGTSSDTETSKPTPATVAQAKSTSVSPYSFVPEKLYPTSEYFKERNYVKYGRYWQSLAETFNEEICKSKIINTFITKSLISCEICKVILTKTVEYEYHVNSPEHILNVKLHRKRVSAHLVKPPTNSSKTSAVEVSKSNNQVKLNDPNLYIPVGEKIGLIPFPLLYCDACEMLLNTPKQFAIHVNGKSHKLSLEKKGKMKIKKVQFPVPNKQFCYSCGLILTGISQYNQHKTGRKHKIRCAQLIEQGFTIPPEEQLPEWNLPKVSSKKPVRYPQFYETFVLGKQEEVSECNEINELLINENGCEKSNCIRTLGTATPRNIPGVQILKNVKSESTPQHIYRIQNKISK